MRDTLPDPLLDREQWVCWAETYVDDRDEVTKVPYNPLTGSRASSTNPDTWADFDLAHGLVEMGEYDGIGFMFSEEDPIAGIDLDKCRNEDAEDAEPWAIEILERLDSYTEISPSGTGYHVFVLGFHPGGRNRRPQERSCESMADWDDPEIEMYDQERFFTMTGDAIDGVSGDLEQRHDEYAAIHEEYVAGDDDQCSFDDVTFERDTSDHTGAFVNELGIPLAVLRESDEKLDDLLTHVEPSGYDYPSASEADFATAVKLLFWRFDRHDVANIIERYRNREKLERHESYLEITIESALREVNDRYMDNMSLLPAERDMLVSEVDPSADIHHRDLIPSCPTCDWVLGEHTRGDDDPTDRYCTECKQTWSMYEVFEI